MAPVKISASTAYLSGVVFGIPAFLGIGKLLIWGLPALNHLLGAVL